MADKVHCIRKTLRLMPQEAKALAEKAAEQNMSISGFLSVRNPMIILKCESF